MSQQQATYKSIFKATSIFGGVQVFNILLTLLRGKVLAILIGTAGMGVNGIFMSTMNLIKSLTSFGLNESAIRDISKAHASGDTMQTQRIYSVFRHWIWFTAILGIVVTLAFAPVLSYFSFHDETHTWSFVALSVTFLFMALMGGIYTLLRATRQIKYLAQANLYGSIAGFVVAVPIFYVYHIDGIVPSLIASSIVAFLVSLYFRNKITIQHIPISLKESFHLGLPMVKLGLSLTFINFLNTLIAFLLNLYIKNTGSIEDVGLYNAGLSIIEGYVGMVFTAMSSDYFPRLSAAIHNEDEWKSIVNKQAELVMIILAAVLVLLLTTVPLLIHLLLDDSFMAAKDFVQWSVLAIPIKGLVWILGFVMLAKSDNKLFLWVEIFANVIVFSTNIFFYHYNGIAGLGMSLVIAFVLAGTLIYTVLYRRYGFVFNVELIKLTLITLAALFSCFLAIHRLEGWPAYWVQAIVVVCTLAYAYRELDKRIGIWSLIQTKILKK